ncbi:CheY-like chemotaxis protein [Tenacibaculum adriaticum]|uniref:CheY-like chemotaxis protein n=1 Tax=Tenacibaculum adriaticum TaxID=413713 RepID=A0A5S5DQF7_9FLAO|nr:response regulator [Tenacibaculum adriaticum]TYP97965.1 CheY-like chemotaxis protein [Tenacibaculum adriaticum]
MKEFTIFYADDDEDDLMFFEEAVSSLCENGDRLINLFLLKNGENLIETIERNNSGNFVVFLDLNMPLKSGFELLEEIRSKPEIQSTPVIMYSTSSNDHNVLQSQKLGANYYAVKPNNFNDLLKIISSAANINWKNHPKDNNNFLFHKVYC